MPRDGSLCTHDRANGMSDYANTGPASTLALAVGCAGEVNVLEWCQRILPRDGGEE